jgi:sterol 3beta-glucosyltransferase
VAERLKIPLHMMFTMPWSATGAFPHPLARLTQYAGFENRLSYLIVDSITWLGVRDIINSFRKKKLKLPPVSLTDRWSGSMLQTNKVPFAYIWSPALVPKPKGAVGASLRAVIFGMLNVKRFLLFVLRWLSWGG